MQLVLLKGIIYSVTVGAGCPRQMLHVQIHIPKCLNMQWEWPGLLYVDSAHSLCESQVLQGACCIQGSSSARVLHWAT